MKCNPVATHYSSEDDARRVAEDRARSGGDFRTAQCSCGNGWRTWRDA